MLSPDKYPASDVEKEMVQAMITREDVLGAIRWKFIDQDWRPATKRLRELYSVMKRADLDQTEINVAYAEVCEIEKKLSRQDRYVRCK